MRPKVTTPRPCDHERFWEKVAAPDANGCLNWARPLDRYGYGNFWLCGFRHKAHRAAWLLLRGPIPDGLELDHLCRNPACVNPDHLEPVTHLVNMRRGLSGAANKAKTHCPQGHEYTEENIKWYQGRRYCRECHRTDNRRRRAIKKL